MADIDKRAYNVLELAQRLARLSPATVFGDGVEHETKDTPAVKALNRKLAAEGMVLLKNDRNVLPIKAGQKVAVVGPVSSRRINQRMRRVWYYWASDRFLSSERES